MKNTFLYILVVLIWGSTWLATEHQLGEVAVEVSLIYRFALASLIVFIYCRIKRLPLRFSFKQHLFIALLGSFNFCLNYIALYRAQFYLSSAMASIGFSMLLLFNIVNTRILFGKKIEPKSYLGALIGITGIIVLFWPEVEKYLEGSGSLSGAGLIFTGTLLASLGNMVSVRNSNNSFPVLQSSGWAMFYGTLFLLTIAIYNKTEFAFSVQPDYLVSLVYLSIFGTVIAFYSYYVLLKDIGPEKTSYSIVMFPVVAVLLSSLFEEFNWSIYTVTGFILVAGGNLLMLIPMKKLMGFFRKCMQSKEDKIDSTSICADASEIKQPG